MSMMKVIGAIEMLQKGLKREVVLLVVAVLLFGGVMGTSRIQIGQLNRFLDGLTENNPFDVKYNNNHSPPKVESIKLDHVVCDISLFYTAAKLLDMYTYITRDRIMINGHVISLYSELQCWLKSLVSKSVGGSSMFTCKPFQRGVSIFTREEQESSDLSGATGLVLFRFTRFPHAEIVDRIMEKAEFNLRSVVYLHDKFMEYYQNKEMHEIVHKLQTDYDSFKPLAPKQEKPAPKPKIQFIKESFRTNVQNLVPAPGTDIKTYLETVNTSSEIIKGVFLDIAMIVFTVTGSPRLSNDPGYVNAQMELLMKPLQPLLEEMKKTKQH